MHSVSQPLKVEHSCDSLKRYCARRIERPPGNSSVRIFAMPNGGLPDRHGSLLEWLLPY
jgi:hypothetical protein